MEEQVKRMLGVVVRGREMMRVQEPWGETNPGEGLALEQAAADD